MLESEDERIFGNSYKYGCENGCDVIFLVGQDEMAWRLPAHTSILQKATPVFCAMFSQHFVPSIDQLHVNVIHVPDVDGRALDNLLRYLYNEPTKIQSVDTGIKTLYASHKYSCPGLVNLCLHFLFENLNANNVLGILRAVLYLAAGEIQNLENVNREFQMANGERINPGATIFNNNTIEANCADLLQKCLELVDLHAEKVLENEDLEDLDMMTIQVILSRDTLNIPNEEIVFSAILKWADKECKRQQLPLTAASKREVLRECLFLPRYLQMSQSAFFRGPVQSGIFTQMEVQVMDRILLRGGGGGGYETSLPTSKLFTNSHQHQQITAIRNPFDPSSAFFPFYSEISRPRRPLRLPITVSPKKKRPSIFDRFLSFRSYKCCCKSLKVKAPPETPTKLNNLSSPVRNRNPQNYLHPNSRERQPVSRNTLSKAAESVIICLACIFD